MASSGVTSIKRKKSIELIDIQKATSVTDCRSQERVRVEIYEYTLVATRFFSSLEFNLEGIKAYLFIILCLLSSLLSPCLDINEPKLSKLIVLQIGLSYADEQRHMFDRKKLEQLCEKLTKVTEDAVGRRSELHGRLENWLK